MNEMTAKKDPTVLALETRALQRQAKSILTGYIIEIGRRLKLADSNAAIFQVYFTSAQEDLNRMLGLIKKAQPEQAEKLKAALMSLLKAVEKMVED